MSGLALADLEFFDREGTPIGWVEGLQVEARPEQVAHGTGGSKDIHRVDWLVADQSAAERTREVDRWIIVSDSAEQAATLSAELQKQGASCLFCEKVEDLEALVEVLQADARRPWGLALLAWSESHLDRADEEPAHRAFRIASWASVIRDHCGAASQVWLATRGLQSVRGEERVSVETGVRVAQEIDTFASCAEMLQCRLFDTSDRLEHAERVSLAGLMGLRNLDRRFAARGDQLFVPRLVKIDEQGGGKSERAKRSRVSAGGRNFRAIHTGAEGLDCLALAEIDEPALATGDLLVEVRSAAFSQLDALMSLGLARRTEEGQGGMPRGTDSGVARDFSGVVRAVQDPKSDYRVGDEVIGVRAGALARRFAVSADSVARKPAFFDFDEAASLPFPFLVAKYALQVVARLRAGERVLILSAGGGIGQALVQVSHAIGAEVNVTASSASRRAVLTQLGARVLDLEAESDLSRSASADGWIDFDVIVSAKSGPELHSMLARLAAGGRYIDLCPRASFERPELGALRLGANRSVSAIDVDEMIRTEPTLVAALLEQIAEDANGGRVRPIESTIFGISEAARGLRFMAQNRHVGRVCIDFSDAQDALVRPDVKPGTELAGCGSFMVVERRAEEDERGMGEAVATWLRSQGVDDVIELRASEVDEALETIRRGGSRLEGWIQIGLEDDGSADETMRLLTESSASFRALVSVRDRIGDASARDRAWETRLAVDQLLLSTREDATRSFSISIASDIDPQRLTHVLDRAIHDELDASQIVVLSEDELSRRLAESPSPILSSLAQGNESRQRSHLLRAELLSMAPPERRSTMERFVCDMLAGVLGLSEDQRLALDVRSPLDAVGLDSLMTMELFMGMGRDLDLEIGADWFQSIPSLEEIAIVLVERFEEAASAREAK